MNTLKQSRQQLGLTQEKMALALGLSLRTYTRNEANGGTLPLRKLAELLAMNAKMVYSPDVSKEMVLQNT